MKAIKYIMSFWAVLSLSLLFFGCADDFENGNNKGDGKSIRLTLSVPENIVVNPMTKATHVASQSVDDITILVYDIEYNIITSKYYKPGSAGLENLNKGGSFTTESIEVGNDASGVVYVVANAGDLSGKSLNELKETKFGLQNDNNPIPKMVMCASGDEFPDPTTGTLPLYNFSGISFDVNSNSNVSAELVRIYAKVTVAIEFAEDLESGLTIIPKTLKLYNVPKTGSLVGPNKIVNASGSQDSEQLNSIDNNGTWNYKNIEESSVLYLYENMQPNGFCALKNGKKDQTSKTPASYGEPTTNTSLLKGDKLSSYIEITADYKKANNPTTGTIIYRFFLGSNPFDNFSIQRNVDYKITLVMHNDGGADEATWRVETKTIPNKINVSDAYISFQGQSWVEMKVTGDVNGIKDYKTEYLQNPNLVDDPSANIVMEELSRDNEKGEMTLKFTANTTNIHDYKEKTIDVKFTMLDGKNYIVRVHQVPRLVDPIAFLKAADKADEEKIIVRAYNSGLKEYKTLSSKGPWTAIINQSSTPSVWYTIYTKDESGAVQQVANTLNGAITGEGEVIFYYKPNGILSSTELKDEGTVGGARFGEILVKYHNESCEHQIFLRQGYNPTKLGNDTYAWSMYNCLGKTANDRNVYGAVTNYPTETGWLFNGGIDVAMHPYEPGYRQGEGKYEPQYTYKGTTIEYSTGAHSYFSFYEENYQRDNWSRLVSGSITDPKNATWKGKRGPCPKGYIVPTAMTYRELTDKAYVYTGYVYDDGPRGGWIYQGNGKGAIIEPESGNLCNPAKGSLFVKRGGCESVFFSYGKGIIADINNKDENLINEIGVGHRYSGGSFQDYNKFGKLTYTDHIIDPSSRNPAYGGYYWSSTPFNNGGSHHMGKVDFGYNIFSKEPTLIDVPGFTSSVGGDELAKGIDGRHNASFVRCVKDPNPDPELEIVYYNFKNVTVTIIGMGLQLTITAQGSNESIKISTYNGKCEDVNFGLPKEDSYKLEMSGHSKILTFEEMDQLSKNGGTLF